MGFEEMLEIDENGNFLNLFRQRHYRYKITK